MSRARLGHWLCAFSGALSLNAAVAFAQSASGPLHVSTQNPRYFADAAGRVVYLTGSHTWSNLQDVWTDSFNIPFDFNQYLNFLQAHNHNFIRMWREEMPSYRYDSNEEWRHSEPHPWMRVSGTLGGVRGKGGGAGSAGSAFDATPGADEGRAGPGGPGSSSGFDGPVPASDPFDLQQFNQAYFDRLRARCIAAGQRGMYVSIMLFEGYGLQFTSEGWSSHPFNVNNNINGINGDPNNDGRGLETHTLAVPAITAIQEAYVGKVIDTVNDLDNVLYEIANESHADSVAWQNHFIDYIHAYELVKPKKHPVVFSSPLADVGTALWDSHAEAISPLSYSPFGSFADDMPANDGAKVILTDTDHIFGCGGVTDWVWKSFTRGLNVIYMDSYYDDTPFCSPPDESMRLAMGYSRLYAARMNMNQTVPRNNLSSTGYCLANVGATYLAFAPQGGAVTLNLTAAAGPCTVEWFDTTHDTAVAFGEIQGGSIHQFNSPYPGAAVLFVNRINTGIAGDVNGNGVVNVDDLLALLTSWGPCPILPNACPADLNHSGSVNVDDLLLVITNWS